FLSRALYLLAFVEPYDNEPDEEYAIPYEDLEVRHLGELYENILEYTVQLADADRIRRRTKKGVEMLLASQATKRAGDTLIKKGDVYFGESALERKQTGSYYTPESLVRFLNKKTIVQPLRETFEQEYRRRFNELLEQAKSGHDAGTRRGAAQSAAALVERFVEEQILNFKVCDPAMGSGHFLVDSANQMAGFIIELFAEIPQTINDENDELGMRNDEYQKNHDSSFILQHSSLNFWRRRITRHCIYGVDLNPLAVNLAKLSLWLNCFASEHKLTFLDHHVRCGNSLIGIRSIDQLASIPERKKESKKKKNPQKLLFDYNDLSSVLTEASQRVASIIQIDEDDTDSQKAVLDEALEATFHLRPLADLFTAYLMAPDIPVGDYKEIFERLAKGISVAGTLNPALPEILEAVRSYRDWHHFYHWPLEFPDVFGPNAVGGFSATVGNPPWDVLQPSTQEFYINYDPDFRKYKKQEALKVIKHLHEIHPRIANSWEDYQAGFKEASSYCKEPEAYTCLQKGKVDLYKVFLERFFTVLCNDGHMGIVVPSGIYTDLGCQPLRERFYNQSRTEFLYCFENRKPVFNIHRSFKFVLFGTQKGGETGRFKCAFMEHDPERLPVIDANALNMSVKQVRKFSPDTLSLIEFKSKTDLQLTTKIYGDWPILGETIENTWNLELSQEFNRSSDSHLFNTDGDGCPLYEGKNTSAYDHQFTPLIYWIRKDLVREDEYRYRWRILKKKNKIPSAFDFEQYRAVFRRIAASTNERSFLATVIPQESVCPDTNLVVRRLRQNPTNGEPVENLNTAESAYLVAVLNCFVTNYVIRQKITTHLDMHFVKSVPVPRLNG
ncbi:MAG: DNA methyltransferase, partial [candidate division Zixibacteria bacterium]|nr:DNA methyltransferase [candidate division Zixibacteria bacterium]